MPSSKRRLGPSEVELARPVVAMLRSYGWEVYQEVKPGQDGGVCDIVATRGVQVWCIEVKRGWGLKILEQAIRWTQWAHWTSVAVGSPIVPAAARPTLEHYGIGSLNVVPDRQQSMDGVTMEYPRKIEERVRPRLNRKARTKHITDWLCDEMKTAVLAGTSGGGYWSPWRSTCREVEKHVKAHGPCTPKALVTAIAHHYATPRSARNSIVDWIRAGKIPGVKCDTRLGALVLYADDTEELPAPEVFGG